eukprot:IDg5221t1
MDNSDEEMDSIRKETKTLQDAYSSDLFVKAAALTVLTVLDYPRETIFQNLQEELTPEIYLNTTSQVLYEEDDELLAEAMERIDRNKNGNSVPDSARSPASSTVQLSRSSSGAPVDNAGRAASAIQQNFKTDTEKFSGDMHGKIPLHVIKRRYLTAISSQTVARDKQKHFSLLDKKFNTLLHQLHTRNYLNDMTFDSVKQELNCSDMQALETIYQRILNLVPQARKNYSVEDAKVDILYHATKGHTFARTALANQMAQSQSTNLEWTFDQFKQHLTTQLAASAERKPGSPFHDITGFNTTHKKLSTPKAATFMVENEPVTEPAGQLISPMAYYGETYANPLQARKPKKFQRHQIKPIDIASMLRGNPPGGPGNRIRKHMNASQLQQIKDKTRCLNYDDEYMTYLACITTDITPPATNGEPSLVKVNVTKCYENPNQKIKDSPPQTCIKTLNDRKQKSETSHSCKFIGTHKFTHRKSVRRKPWHIPLTLMQLRDATKGNNHRFQGALMDTGAQKSVVGLQQAKAYCREINIPFELLKDSQMFRFGKGNSKAIGKIQLVIPTPGSMIVIKVSVIRENIPFLIGLDVMDRYSLQTLTVFNKIQCVSESWEVPATRKFGHVYWVWESLADTFLSKATLKRLHHHLMHPSAKKLYNILGRANPKTFGPHLLPILKEISNSCNTCQIFSPRNLYFRIRDPDSVRFNQRIILDVMFLSDDEGKKKPVLHIVDAGTKFQAAAFLKNSSTQCIWTTFMHIWSLMYIGFPESMLTDEGSVFTSDIWKYTCEVHDIQLIHTGTESHNSMGAGETYHAILRRIYNKVRMEFKGIEAESALLMSVKAINDTVGPHGLCPSLLVFGILPRLPEITLKDFPSVRERKKALVMARIEYEKHVAAQLISRGKNSIPPQAASHTYLPAAPRDLTEKDLQSDQELPHEIGDLDQDRGPKILWTEIIYPGDPRAAKFDDAIRKEILGLIERKTFKIVLKEEAGDNPNIVPARFILAVKHDHDGSTLFKARFVMGGHRDREKHLAVHKTTNMKQSSLRMILALATILGLDVWSIDIKQAYLQSGSDLQRKIFINPKEMILGPEELIQVIKPLYGLTESGDYWCETLINFHIHNLRMHQSTGDFALFFRRIVDKMVSLSGCYVDDIIMAGTKKEKERLMVTLRDKFTTKVSYAPQFNFIGMLIDSSDTERRKILQNQYIKRLQPLSPDATWQDYRSIRAKLIWVVHTRPDIACAASMAAQITQGEFNTDDIAEINRIVHYLHKTHEICLQYPKLDLETLKMVVYADASFNNAKGNRSQLGYIVTLADKTGNCSILHYSSYKSSRVTRSSMAGETLAFVDAFDQAYILRHDLDRILNQFIPVIMLTDSEILFKVLTRARCTTEKRLMVDISATRQAYNDHLISNVGLISSEDNPADGLTKTKPNKALINLLRSHKLNHNVKQYVIRKPPNVLRSERPGCVENHD